MLGYEFVSLTPEQVEARRKLLDQAGLRAHMLPIVILLAIYISRKASSLVSNKSDSSPRNQLAGVQLQISRAKWILSNTYVAEFGQLHVQIFGLTYAAILLYIIFKGTGKDYMHVTKAFGHVAVSQLPYQYWFSLKHPKSPITLATGLTHERLNAYHRLFGRITHALLATHAILYIWFFIAINVLAKRLNDWDVRYGLMAIWTLNFLGLLAIGPVRQKVYHKVFYQSHVVLSIVLPVVIWLHVPYTRKYMAEAIFVWIGNGFLRKDPLAEKASVTCRKVGGKLLHVAAKLKKGEAWQEWVPGMHGYLIHGVIGPRSPFTVIDVTKKGSEVKVDLVIRDLGGPMTGTLGKAAEKGETLTLELEGPYGEAKEYIPHHLKAKDQPVLIVAGGVGATYALPIYVALAESRKDFSNLKLIWIVKRLDDARWGMEMLNKLSGNNVQICVTGDIGSEKASSTFALSDVEVLTQSKRPNFDIIVDSFLATQPVSETQKEKRVSGKPCKPVSVMVCGPGSLSQALRRAVGRHAWNGREINWYEEQFGFGGS